MDFLREITEEYSTETIPLMEAISQAVKELKMMKKGGKVTNKMVKDFISKNPSLTTAAAINALAAYKQYKTNKRNTINLFAKSPYDKRMMTQMITQMLNSKQFKLTKSKYADGGKYWELQKVKSGF